MSIEEQKHQYNQTEENSISTGSQQKRRKTQWIWTIILILILAAGGYMRTVGMDWDDHEHLHPDERFLTFVVSSIHPNENPGDFFNTEKSTMNPNNVGYEFFVYGTLPLFIVRAAADQLSVAGWDMYLVGRYVSATFDILTIFVAYLIGYQLFKKDWIAVLGAAFYACSVLPIQLSHYFTVDIQANFFSMTAFYFAVVAMRQKRKVNRKTDEEYETNGGVEKPLTAELILWVTGRWKEAIPYLLFGVFYGLAMASKVSVLPIAVLIALAALVSYMGLSNEDRKEALPFLIRNVILAAIVSVVVFRIGQPYAFNGPGFFGIQPNKEWINDLMSLSGQAKGLVDFPPALQWSRRPLSFGFTNLVQWGLGLPLGIWAWISFFWMLWKIIRYSSRRYLVLLWLFTAAYFVWQSLAFNSMMRYFMQIYVPLSLIADWGFSELFNLKFQRKWFQSGFRILSPILCIGIVLSTTAWAFAFSNIYTRPATRVEASDWYFQNISGPINLNVLLEDGGEKQQVLPYEAGVLINAEQPLVYSFQAVTTGTISEIHLSHIRTEHSDGDPYHGLYAEITSSFDRENLVGYGELFTEFRKETNQMGDPQTIFLAQPAYVEEGEDYFITLKSESALNNLSIAGSIYLDILRSDDGTDQLQVLPEAVHRITETTPKTTTFTSKYTGQLRSISIPNIADHLGVVSEKTLQMQITDGGNFENTIITKVASDFLPVGDPKGEEFTFNFDPPINLIEGNIYYLDLSLNGVGSIAIYGTKQVNESSWDDVVPQRRDGYDPFSETNGVYRTELNFEMYWDDNEDKRERFLKNLDEADLIMITSSRQWANTTRVPERYPMTSMYYRELLGCPAGENIERCYEIAKPGMFTGNLGFELVEVFQSNPNIGSFEINDQSSEEAFTVYDHPKVLLFEKSDAYDIEAVRQLFYAVDLDAVIHMIPAEVPQKTAKNLLLPPDRLAGQQAGGTWSELFDSASVLNSQPIVGGIVWYVCILLLGWIMYPVVRMAFSGLVDRGYAVSRFAGLLLIALCSWLLGSAAVPVTRMTVWLVIAFLGLLSLFVFLKNRIEIIAEIRESKKMFLMIELVALFSFLAFLLIRLGNPDLWHQYKGGEKPMDFSYLNAVIKSTTFPPYDPWFAGGYINYYYYGFVIVGMPIKALGIEPAIAYNLVLPTLFSCFSLAAFTFGYNVLADREKVFSRKWSDFLRQVPVFGGLFAVIFSLIIGNIGTIKMVINGLMRLGGVGDPGLMHFWNNASAFFKGVGMAFQGNLLPFYPGDWYWIPSRAIPGEAITEFPFFTFLYADLHAHLIALPITLFVLVWGLSVLRAKWTFKGVPQWEKLAVSLIFGAVAVGALRPTNTWDFPVYLVLSVLIIGYALIRNFHYDFSKIMAWIPEKLRNVTFAGLVSIAFILLCLLLYSPFSEWYGQGYSAIKYWEGDHTPIGSYLIHWSVFLFVLLSWLAYEIYDWMRVTPVSNLKVLRPYRLWIQIGMGILLMLLVALAILGVSIIWIALPIALLAGMLLFRPGISDRKRFVLFMTGTGLVLTILVELIALEGDIGRMNTVFKFYLQAWVLLSLSSAAALCWLIPAVRKSGGLFSILFRVVFGILFFSALLYPVMATRDKINDRMQPDAPHTLDGMAYMAFSSYNDQGQEYSLSEDYLAIQWMQENIEGSPVIIEGNTVEYRWGSRYTIYTGLPSVVGWNWHQRQQRTIVSSERVTDRVDDVKLFYNTTDVEEANAIVEHYDVSYIVVGKLEQVYFLPEGLEKFDAFDGKYWTTVYQVGETTIYKVIE